MTEIVCAGGLFLARDTKRFLFLLRTQGKTAGTWGLVGGKKEPADLTPHDTLIREVSEEVGKIPTIKKVVPLELFTSRDQLFHYNTYVLLVDKEFIPVLNDEHHGYAWVADSVKLRPIHPGLYSTINFDAVRSKIATIQQQYTS